MLVAMAAGGMGGTRRHPDGAPGPGSRAGRPYDDCPARHCWVADAVDGRV